MILGRSLTHSGWSSTESKSKKAPAEQASVQDGWTLRLSQQSVAFMGKEAWSEQQISISLAPFYRFTFASTYGWPDFQRNWLRWASQKVFGVAKIFTLVLGLRALYCQGHDFGVWHLQVSPVRNNIEWSVKILTPLTSFTVTSKRPPCTTGTLPPASLQNTVWGSGWASTLHSRTPVPPFRAREGAVGALRVGGSLEFNHKFI